MNVNDRRGGEPARTETAKGASRERPAPLVLPFRSIGDLFKGCDALMRGVHAGLTRGGGGQSAIVALHGLGGIGKTRVAVEYA